jgi:hypothetical protein
MVKEDEEGNVSVEEWWGADGRKCEGEGMVRSWWKEMWVWRNGEVLMKGNVSVKEWWGADGRKQQEYSFKKLRKNNVYISILFSTPYFTQWNPNTGATISVFVCWQELAFPVCMDILKYLLAQATDWCAGFLVLVWWRYLRVRFDDTVKCRENFELDKKKRRPFHYLLQSVLFSFTMPLIAAIQLVRITWFVDLPQQVFHMYRPSLRKKHLPFTVCWYLDSSGDRVGNDDDIIIIIVSFTIMIIDCAVSSVTWHIPIPIFMRLSSSYSAASILRMFRLIELHQDDHVCDNSGRTLKHRKQYRMQH